MSEQVNVADLRTDDRVEHDGQVKTVLRVTYNTKDGKADPFQYHVYFSDAEQLRKVKPSTSFTVLSDDDVAEEEVIDAKGP